MVFKRKMGPDGKRRRFSPLLWLASLAAILLLILGITGTLAQFTASILNPNNNVDTIGPEAFDLSESLVVNGNPAPNPGGGGPPCADALGGQSATCAVINKYGQDGNTPTPLAPGATRTTTVRLLNTGTALTGVLTLTVGRCTQTPVDPGVANPSNSGTIAGDLCSALLVTLNCSAPASPPGVVPAPGAPLGTGAPAPAPNPAGSFAAGSPYTIATLGPGAFTDCTFTVTWPVSATAVNLEGLSINQPLTFTLTQSV